MSENQKLVIPQLDAYNEGVIAFKRYFEGITLRYKGTPAMADYKAIVEYMDEFCATVKFIDGGNDPFKEIVADYWLIDLKGSRSGVSRVENIATAFYKKIHLNRVALDSVIESKKLKIEYKPFSLE